MIGRIFRMGARAKIEIWKEAWMVGENIDGGGTCEICNTKFSSILELVRHFMTRHNGGNKAEVKIRW